MWRRAGEELITHRQAGEQQTDAMRARLSSAQPGWREERGSRGKKRDAGMEGDGEKERQGMEEGMEGEIESSRGGNCDSRERYKKKRENV